MNIFTSLVGSWFVLGIFVYLLQGNLLERLSAGLLPFAEGLALHASIWGLAGVGFVLGLAVLIVLLPRRVRLPLLEWLGEYDLAIGESHAAATAAWEAQAEERRSLAAINAKRRSDGYKAAILWTLIH